MILTVTLNAAVDRTYRVEGFALDRIHRATEWRVAAGGKGVNVARVYRTLGGHPVATGFLGGYNGRYVARALEVEGIAARFVRSREESRICIAVVDPIVSTQTEINEVGPRITPREVGALKRAFRRILNERTFQFAALSGSIPPGVPDTIYADLIGIARSAGVRCVLDASGEALKAGCEAQPWMLKPNIYEASVLLGRDLRSLATDAEIHKAARCLLGTGAEVACVTLGSRGCVCATETGAWMAVPPAVQFVSAVGSGDSFLGAFLWALGEGRALTEALRLAVGAGAANAAVYGAGFCTKEAMDRLAAEVRLTPLAASEVDKPCPTLC